MGTTYSETMSGEEVNAKFIEVVSKRSGGGGILGLSRNFSIIDRDGSGSLTIDEFKLAMKKFQVDSATRRARPSSTSMTPRARVTASSTSTSSSRVSAAR